MLWPSLPGARCAEFAAVAQDRIVQEYRARESGISPFAVSSIVGDW